MLTVERDSQDAKHLAPLVWQGPVSKNETNNNPPPNQWPVQACPVGLCTQGLFSARFCSICHPYTGFSLSPICVFACALFCLGAPFLFWV